MSEENNDAAAIAAAAALRRATKSTAPARKRRAKSTSSSFSDDRDPQLLGSAVDRMIQDQGWQDESAAPILVADWAQIVGSDLAAHVTPLSFQDGELTVQADSTAWSKAISQLLPTLRRAIDDKVGTGVVTAVRIQGPYAPSWTAGSRRVRGRGPRDTYG